MVATEGEPDRVKVHDETPRLSTTSVSYGTDFFSRDGRLSVTYTKTVLLSETTATNLKVRVFAGISLYHRESVAPSTRYGR